MCPLIKERTQQPIILNNAIHEFEALEKRVFYIVMNQISKDLGIDKEIFNESLWFDVPTKLLGTKNYDRLKDVVEGITSRKIRILNKKGEEIHVFVPFPEIKYQKRWGYVKVRILDTAYPYLAELSDGYFWYRLKSALMLSRTYSQRFYEWFCQYLNLGKWNNVMIEDLRLKLEIPQNEYLRNNDFVRRIVHDSIKEVNTKTDIHAEIAKYHKVGRKIVGFDFIIRDNEAEEEAAKLKQIEQYYKHINSLPRNELGRKIMDIKNEYKINNNWFNKMFEYKELMEEALKVDAHIKAGKVEVETTNVKYMNGALKRKIEEMNLN